jgi:hypothetical protein
MIELVPDALFRWLLTIIVAGVCAPWLFYDTRNLVRTLRMDGADPSVRDKRFGYAIGICVAIIGLVGTLMYRGVL